MAKGNQFVSLLVILALVLALGTALVPTKPVGAGCFNPVYVDASRPDDTGDGSSWATAKKYIQSGVGAVCVGGTVYVAAGTYTENVDINMSLTLTGAGAASTIVQGSASDHVFYVTADSVTISGFTATGATDVNKCGIRMEGADTCTLSNCNASGNNFGIWLVTSHNNTISSNTASNNQGRGIYLITSNSNTIINNTTKNNSETGIFLHDSDNNTLSGNDTGNNPTTQQDYGIVLNLSDDNTISGNTITNNEFYGIHLYGGSDANTISGNQVHDNLAEGIYLDTCTGCIIDGNTVHDNDVGYPGIYLHDSTNSTIQSNEVYNEAIGISLEGADDNTIINNSIHDNGCGIWVHFGVGDFAENNRILSNSIVNNGGVILTGIHLTSGALNTVINFNIIVGNSPIPGSYGLYSLDPNVNAENNWWGANNGPGGVGPGSGDAVSTNVDYDPWLVLNISADPTSIETGSATSTITADMTKNSAGQDTSGQGHIPDGTQIIFTTDKGSIGSTTVTASALPHSSATTARITVGFVAPTPPPQPAAPRPTELRPAPVMPNAPHCYVPNIIVNPTQASPNQPVVIIVNVANSGGSLGTYTVNLMINGYIEGTKTLSVPPVSAVPVSFTISKAQPGTYTVTVDSQQASFTILGTATKGSSGWTLGTGGIITLIVIGIIIVVGLVFALRRPTR